MSIESIKSAVRSLHIVESWPEMSEIIDRVGHRESVSAWEYSAAACKALGGSGGDSLPGDAAVFCSLISIKLVDDMIDEDPAGLYLRVGPGKAANLALAFQAAAHHMVDQASLPDAISAALHQRIAEISLATSYGQNLDSLDAIDEEGYWRAVHAKTPPLFSAAMAIGALLAGGSKDTSRGLESFGRELALFIQISDDLSDCLSKPAGADWRRPNNNLALLYAQQADHEGRQRFKRLVGSSSDPVMLAEAQTLLLSSGAVSYCIFKMLEMWNSAKRVLKELEVLNPAPLEGLLHANLKPVERLFSSLGGEVPSELRRFGF